MEQRDRTLEYKLLLGSQGFGIWFLVSELLYLVDVLFSNHCGVAHWLFHRLWELWICCKKWESALLGAQGCCSVLVVAASADWENIYKGIACYECFPVLSSLSHNPSFWDSCKRGATTGFDGRKDWKTYGMAEEMDMVPFGAKIFLK